MKWIGLALLGLLGAAVLFSTYVRLAPTDADRWHKMPGAMTNRDLSDGAMRVTGAGADELTRLDAIIRETPRTTRLAGSVEDGMITYVTRSLVFGFPDYTTIRKAGPQIEIHGRQRFGGSDMGVNAARIDRWLKAFAQRG